MDCAHDERDWLPGRQFAGVEQEVVLSDAVRAFAAEARAYSASLERKGFKPFIVTGKVRGKGTWYRVRLGRFTSESQATEGKLLLARADIPAWVLKTE